MLGVKHGGHELPAECQIRAKFHLPPTELRQYFTTFYLVEINVPDGQQIEDCIHPEWGGLRMFSGSLPEGHILNGQPFGQIANVGQGPTTNTIHFKIGSCRMWGVGLLPAGWAKFIARSADGMANTVFDVNSHEAFAPFASLTASLFGKQPDPAAELERIEQHFLSLASLPCPDEARILAIHKALIDPDNATVQEFAESAGIKPYTLERLCRRYFGFPPSLLLRRQRFLRSLVQYTLDPSRKWVRAIDPHYHDQAQFVRDFHHFMGMSPREYAAKPHPILDSMIRARVAAMGSAVQVLHPPQMVPSTVV